MIFSGINSNKGAQENVVLHSDLQPRWRYCFLFAVPFSLDKVTLEAWYLGVIRPVEYSLRSIHYLGWYIMDLVMSTQPRCLYTITNFYIYENFQDKAICSDDVHWLVGHIMPPGC